MRGAIVKYLTLNTGAISEKMDLSINLGFAPGTKSKK